MINPLSYFYSIRSYVDAYAGFLGRRFLSLVWVAAAAIIIWFYGPSLALGDWRPLEPVLHRLIAIGVIVGLWAVWMLVSIVRKRRADKEMIDDLAEGEADPERERRAEVDVLRGRLQEALGVLRKTTGRRFGYVYELPWYMIVGAPGSGKTTLLRNSGLKFPLGDGTGGDAADADPVEGVGGTRNCNWWFTEDAILIDTAGRYTTQGDFGGTDKAGWLGFLGLLRKHRPSQPVNGVIVTLSVRDMLHQSPDERLAEIRSVRQRLSELDENLRARVPVYVVLTKTDLLGGFGAFFDALPKSEREQVWGMTFDLEMGGGATATDAFAREFDLLLERLQTLLLERLQQEPDLETRGRIFRFPAEVASLREALREVVAELTSGSRFARAPLLRGVYMASSTQGVVGAMGAISGATAAAGPASMQRSFFTRRLFSDVLFGEAALVSRDLRLGRRALWLRRAAVTACIACVAVAGVAWTASYARNSAALARVEQSLDDYGRLAKDVPTREVADSDFLRVLPALDALAGGSAALDDARILPAAFSPGSLSTVERQHATAYRRALNALLLPRLAVRLQGDLADDLSEGDAPPHETFETLKLYSMLGGMGPLDAAYVKRRAGAIFERLYKGQGRRAARAALNGHVAALVARPLAPLDLDPILLADARKAVTGRTYGERAYDMLRLSKAATALPEWKASAVITSLGESALRRASKAPLSQGVAGLHTRTGLEAAILPNLMRASEEALAESWVRGEAAPAGLAASDVARDALQLHFAAFEEAWRGYTDDLAVRDADGLSDATEVSRALASKPAPVTALARSIAEATDLAGRGDATEDADTAAKAKRAATLALWAKAPVEIDDVPDPYGPLRRALARDGDAPSQVEAFAEPLDAIYAQLSRASSSNAQVIEIFGVEGKLAQANQALLGEARRLPAPLDTWMAGFAADVAALSLRTARDSIAREWQSGGAEVCRAAVAGRYPFKRDSTRDVALDDFTRVFGPDGVFDGFFKTRLAPFVDTTSSPWRWQGGLGTETVGTSTMSKGALAQFERARAIRDAFFPEGRLALSLDVTPVSMSKNADTVMLEMFGRRVVYFHGPVRSKSINWPAREGETQSRIAFLPGGLKQGLRRQGPWSPFRLFDAAKLSSPSDDVVRAAFTVRGRRAAFDVRMGSVANPFRLPALESFSCPQTL